MEHTYTVDGLINPGGGGGGLYPAPGLTSGIIYLLAITFVSLYVKDHICPGKIMSSRSSQHLKY